MQYNKPLSYRGQMSHKDEKSRVKYQKVEVKPRVTRRLKGECIKFPVQSVIIWHQARNRMLSWTKNYFSLSHCLWTRVPFLYLAMCVQLQPQPPVSAEIIQRGGLTASPSHCLLQQQLSSFGVGHLVLQTFLGRCQDRPLSARKSKPHLGCASWYDQEI